MNPVGLIGFTRVKISAVRSHQIISPPNEYQMKKTTRNEYT